MNEALDNSSGSMDEAAVNAAAAKEVEAAKASVVEQPVAAEVTQPVSADPVKAAQKTAPQNTAPTEQPAFDAQKSYEEVQKQLAETRKWATQQAQMRAQFEKELAAIKQSHQEVAKKLAEATEAPFNLEQFNKDFTAHGFKAFDPYLEKKLSSVKEQYEPVVSELKQSNQSLQTELTILKARSDSKNYPNFNDLEPKMIEILNSENCPVDKTLPLEERLQAAYNLAKTANSEEAIKAAQAAGYQKAQADLAKEAKTSVATGGKGTSTTPADMRTMPLDKLEQLAIQMYGIADRD